MAKVLRGKGTKQPIKIYKIFIINTLPTVQNQLQIYILCTFATLYLCTFDTFTFKTKKMTGTFEELIASEKPILIDFFATWCGPCKALTPTLQQLAQEEGEKIRIVKIDVDQNPKLAAKYRVTGVPTLILFQNSELKWRQSGVLSLPQLKDVVKKFA
jgi:thioredoxin 1